jgi:large subunit ribosomal protein L18
MAKSKEEARQRRKKSIRTHLRGTADRPRLTVFRSARHMYAQIVDDVARKTLCSASTLEEALQEALKGLKKRDQAKQVGAALARKCVAQKIESIVFDRNGYKYHGRVMSLAAGAREAGLKF